MKQTPSTLSRLCSALILAALMGAGSTASAQASYFKFASAFTSPSTSSRCIVFATTVDSAGNVYTTGFFYGTVDFDPGPGTQNLTGKGGADIFVTKQDASGALVWAKAMGGTYDDVSFSIAVDGLGNVYTTGYFQGTADFDPGPGIQNLSLTRGGLNNDEIFVSKLDSAGAFVWAKAMGSAFDDEGLSIAVDGLGNVYTTGYFYGTVDFDPGPGTQNLTSKGYQNIFISKLDSSGAYIWAKAMGGSNFDYGNAITVDAGGNVYTTGAFTDTADFDPGPGTHNLTPAGNDFDIFVSKLDTGGAYVWAGSMGGLTSELGYSIAVDGSGNLYAAGAFSGTADFDPGPASATFTTTGAGGFVVKLAECAGTSLPTGPASATLTARFINGLFEPLNFISNCSDIAMLRPTGASAVSGSVTGKVWVEPGVGRYSGAPFVARHYELTPASNASTATGTVTLYFSQAEFTAYNAVTGHGPDLPIDANDTAHNKANLRITKKPGVSSDGTGLPLTYPTVASTIITPTSVVWDGTNSRWAVTFDVTGFSGFFAHTGDSPLAIAPMASGHSVMISPSPAHDYFRITTGVAGVHARLYDLLGREQMSFAVTSGMRVDIASLPAGLYLLKLSNGSSFKIVKE